MDEKAIARPDVEGGLLRHLLGIEPGADLGDLLDRQLLDVDEEELARGAALRRGVEAGVGRPWVLRG
ncbi:MAG: hypothetical protein HZB56_12495 [Deltaproteobacteria bacterium]|nr:hypothetical protein [Deltaproteobacteria bacterium]